MTFTLAICSEMVYLDMPHLDRVRRIHERGFAAEIWGWSDKEPQSLKDTGAVFTSMTGYLAGDLTTEAGTADLLRTAEESIPFAKTIGCPSLNLHGTGLGDRGLPVHPVEVVTGEMWLAAIRALTAVSELGEKHDVTFVLENLNTELDHPGTPFGRAADTLALVRAVGSPHLRMNLDLYHAQIGEGNLAELIRRAAPHVGEVQIADVPGRCEPRTGEVRWEYLARVLADTGYSGVVALEGWASEPGTEGSDLALDRFREAFTV